MHIENGKTVYDSLSELSKSSKNKKHPTDKEREKFLGTCKICKQPLTYIAGTNVVVCSNPSCNGFKHTRKDKEGNDVNSYSPVYRVLNEKNSSYAEYLFEKDVK